MKKLISILLFTAFAFVAHAQIPLQGPVTVYGNEYITDSLGVGTSSPAVPFHVIGQSRITDGDSAFINIGITENLLFGALPLLRYGAVLSKNVGDWVWTTGASSDNLSGSIQANISSLNLNTGESYSIATDSSKLFLKVYNVLSASSDNYLGIDTNGIDLKLRYNSSSYFKIVNSTQTIFNIDNSGAVTIKDGNEASGYVLTSDANGVGSWQQAQETTLYTDVTEATTTTTDWETLATYNIAANTLSANGNSLEIHMAHVGTVTGDSIRLVLGSTNVFLDNNAGENNDNIKTTIARQSAGNQLFFTGNDFGTGTEDETTQLTLSFQAKSVTIGNQSLKYFKVKRSE